MRTQSLTFLVSTVVAATLLDPTLTLAQDAGKPSTAAQKAAKAMPPRDELEARFKATLTKATLTGRWCGIKEGKLEPENRHGQTYAPLPSRLALFVPCPPQ